MVEDTYIVAYTFNTLPWQPVKFDKTWQNLSLLSSVFDNMAEYIICICIPNLDPIRPILAELCENLEIVIYAILRDIAIYRDIA